jgi:hypothetical protein
MVNKGDGLDGIYVKDFEISEDKDNPDNIKHKKISHSDRLNIIYYNKILFYKKGWISNFLG